MSLTVAISTAHLDTHWPLKGVNSPFCEATKSDPENQQHMTLYLVVMLVTSGHELVLLLLLFDTGRATLE